jgi:hypothetical protein
MKRLWRAVGRYLWLVILVLTFLTCVINEFPANYGLILKPGVVLPNGIITHSGGLFYDSFLLFIEKPSSKKLINKTSVFNPKEVNSYLQKMEQYTKDYDLSPYPEIKKIDRIFPVSSEGKERILILGCDENEYGDWSLYLFDTQHKLLHKSDFYGGYVQYFISAKFTNRLWIQIGSSGTSGELYMYEISIANDKIDIKSHGYGIEYEYHTYKIMNHRTNPRMVLYQKAYVPLLNWILYFLLFEALMLVLGLFLISRKL